MRRRERPRRKSRLLCPHCRSDRVVLDAGLVTGQRYHCLSCDYVGALILEVDEPVESTPPP